jgi:hypothetical protein
MNQDTNSTSLNYYSITTLHTDYIRRLIKIQNLHFKDWLLPHWLKEKQQTEMDFWAC